MTTSTYFAYGSNMDPDRMGSRCPSATPIGTAELTGWRLHIGHRGVATIVPADAQTTWGGLWDIPEEELPALDRAEGVALGFYDATHLDVVTTSGTVTARTYIEPFHSDGPPRRGYLGHLITGATYFGLPTEHRDHIASLSH